MNILALDLATRTGWAIREGSAPILSGVQTFELGRGESPGMRYVRFSRWLAEMMVRGADPLAMAPPGRRVDLCVFELGFRRGGAATAVSGALEGLVLQACALYGIEHVAVNVSTLKKFATGKGNAKKPEMVMRAVARWPEQFQLGTEPDDNQSDALHLLAYGEKLYGLPQRAGAIQDSPPRP